MTELKLSPIQRRIMDVLADGLVHKKAQLLGCIDEHADVNQLRTHINKLRNALRASSSLDVVAYNGEGYRLVRLISSQE